YAPVGARATPNPGRARVRRSRTRGDAIGTTCRREDLTKRSRYLRVAVMNLPVLPEEATEGTMSIVDEILDLYCRRGDATYGEGVTQSVHALQSAWAAEREGATAALVAAALLHDIGHLLHGLPEDIAEQGVDAQHESVASAWL